MQRLQGFILGAEKNDDSYARVYEGAMYDAFAAETVYEAVYWQDGIGFEVTKSKKNEPARPTVTVRVAFDAL